MTIVINKLGGGGQIHNVRGRDAKKRGAGENGRRRPHICPFWYTTAVSRPVKVHQKAGKICEKIVPKRPKYCVLSGTKHTGLKKAYCRR